MLFSFFTEASYSYWVSDANWVNDINNRISTSGFVLFIGKCCVSWKSHKQRCVARSTTEAEYVALSEFVQEAISLRRLLSELGFQQTEPTKIYEDNRGAIELKNPKFHNRTKHIDIAYDFTREKVLFGEIIIEFCRSYELLADCMTKLLPKPMFTSFLEKLNVYPDE